MGIRDFMDLRERVTRNTTRSYPTSWRSRCCMAPSYPKENYETCEGTMRLIRRCSACGKEHGDDLLEKNQEDPYTIMFNIMEH